MILIDKLCYTSGLRYVNTMEKFIFSISAILFCVGSRSIVIALLVLGTTGALSIWKGGVPAPLYFRLLSVPLVFLILSTSAVMIDLSRTALDAFAIPVGPFYITAGYDGIAKGIQLTCTALASVSSLYFLSLSTPVTDILPVFRRLHLPAVLIELMLLIYRYIFILLETASALGNALNSRMGNRDIRTARRSFVSMISSVFILSVKRSGALYDAMESRCYDGTIHVLSEDRPAKRSEILFLAAFELLLAALTICILLWRKS